MDGAGFALLFTLISVISIGVITSFVRFPSSPEERKADNSKFIKTNAEKIEELIVTFAPEEFRNMQLIQLKLYEEERKYYNAIDLKKHYVVTEVIKSELNSFRLVFYSIRIDTYWKISTTSLP